MASNPPWANLISNMQTSIRKASLEDLERLAEINSLGSLEGKQMALERLPEFIKAKNLILAQSGDSIVGLLYWKTEFFGTENWELTQVTVAPESRQQGIARELIKHFLQIAKEAHVHSVYADVRTSNNASMNMCEKLGAQKVGNLEISEDSLQINFWKFET